MNYIVFDLEWNQSPYGQSGEHPRMPFEIIEIGAVKLNDQFEIIDEYTSLIKPKLYKKLHRSIRAMLNYSEEELKTGKSFKDACSEFLKWCGDDYSFCTWGASDLYYLQSNMDFYYMEKLAFPLKFYNIQQIYADMYDDEGKISKLEKACSELKIPEDEPFHAAINDAKYTARVLAKIKPDNLEERYTFDIYRHPKKKEDEIIARHAGVLERISREYSSKQEAMSDKDLLIIRCAKCGRKCFRKVKWFQNGSSTSMAIGRCVYHGYMSSRIKFKSAGSTEDGVFIVKKTERTNRKGYEEVKARQIELREKRKMKRHKEKE
ncbi:MULTISPECIES: 3'-5' exonuclease [Eubacterium]|jgi:inhibitor of KinA sporulation pathway (predicted exonuclease)|uniref:Inhibitor of the KinA pathway to sporulation, predicted exonuclease n=1 Tax=Eubacterium ruminantium TaxID=42322 RepID=A0A1T4N0G6_9FIRM|nr:MULTISPECIES: 3'-5' exonuclease [Eubacterium]MCR5368937.1 exonuclease domain-containing protein [Eubacterium sp.]SCW51323.1 Inhibitor of the KinA pathway to sporulation, predicted exonuclease [Eubacterium ruminantium]SDM68073.1 Inhibitor of the KinA pathway to sporulation, predicted exonuclease [Eubacterium ruminantium]SJZ72773.1 Inhibitor of the KinA pathway to sporulation, predicted exonuclease [Eubacterium ruminantium]